MISSYVEDILDEWCDSEILYWADGYRGIRDFESEFSRLNEYSPTIFIFDVAAGRVTVRPKAGIIGPDGDIHGVGMESLRVSLYKRFFEDAVRDHAPELRTSFAMDVHDISVHETDAPLFSFQKTASSRNILVPDIDFMHHGWYEERYDEVSFGEKFPRAMFVGASTGGGILSVDDVANDRPPRLAVARQLMGRSDIIFLIGIAAQCDSAESQALLSSKPYFSLPVSWQDQLKNKFIISIDGNGATCSRVVNTLRSNSVLVKMFSPNLLYYFRGLLAWKHYIPVDGVDDLSLLMADYAAGRSGYDRIMIHAKEFFNQFLSKQPVHVYMAKLLSRYQQNVVDGLKTTRLNSAPSLIIGTLGHFAQCGDVLAAASTWLQAKPQMALEGLELRPSPGIAVEAARYRVLTHDGWSSWAQLGEFCGARGKVKPLTGIEIELTGPDAINWCLQCTVTFLDGALATLNGQNGRCSGSNGSPIVAINIAITALQG